MSLLVDFNAVNVACFLGKTSGQKSCARIRLDSHATVTKRGDESVHLFANIVVDLIKSSRVEGERHCVYARVFLATNEIPFVAQNNVVTTTVHVLIQRAVRVKRG